MSLHSDVLLMYCIKCCKLKNDNMITVQELIDKLNALPDKNKEIYCKDLWEGFYKEIQDVDIEDDEPIITVV